MRKLLGPFVAAALAATTLFALCAGQALASHVAQSVQMNDADFICAQPAPDRDPCIVIRDVARKRHEPLRSNVLDDDQGSGNRDGAEQFGRRSNA